jgi:hypothetical protein
VLIGFFEAARIGDKTAHGGKIVEGEPTVIIGDEGSGEARCLCMAAAAGSMGVQVRK